MEGQIVKIEKLTIDMVNAEQGALLCECGRGLIDKASHNGRIRTFVKGSGDRARLYRWYLKSDLLEWKLAGRPSTPIVTTVDADRQAENGESDRDLQERMHRQLTTIGLMLADMQAEQQRSREAVEALMREWRGKP